MLFDNVHKPVSGKMCNQCHEEATSATPFKTKKEGTELCRGCHSNMMNEMLLKNRVHWPVLSKNGCLSCHNPHASAETGLRRGNMKELCGTCHADTVERMEQNTHQHEPVRQGDCTVCHQPHVSNSTFLLKQPLIELCGTCHDSRKHQSHPMGEKVRDRRNKNLAVDCSSCHSAHGTENKSMLLHATVSEMCTQCHTEYGR
jgi:predicted CXXCH cytochrome family protein